MNKEVAPPCIAMSLSAPASEEQTDHPMRGGATPLFVASQQGRQEVICLLPDAGADKDIASQCKVAPPPLFIASQSGHLEVACCFSDAGADTDIAYQGDATPLLVASGTDNLEVSGFRCDGQGGGILHCDVLVGPCIREPTNHLLAPLLGCDEQRSGTTLHCDVFVGPCIRERINRPLRGVQSEMRRARGTRCPC